MVMERSKLQRMSPEDLEEEGWRVVCEYTDEAIVLSKGKENLIIAYKDPDEKIYSNFALTLEGEDFHH